MRRPLSLLASSIVAISLLLSGSLAPIEPASAATTTKIATTTTCSNGVANTGGLGLICDVTILNTITASGGSAAVTVRECHGAAGAPTAACTTTRWRLGHPVRVVNQCNDSANGGGATVRCSVKVTNNFVRMSPGASAVTVNQCVGSGGKYTGCDPFPATTTNAKITQCNGSATGGTLVQLKCTASGTRSSRLGVTVNQCNGSANGGGALVICSASVVNRRVTAAEAPNGTPPPTDTQPLPTAAIASTQAVWVPIVMLLAGSLTLAFALVGRRHRS